MRGRLMRNVSLARMTTWGTGGSADRVYAPADVEDLAEFLSGLDPRDEVLWVGLGSNLLVRDGGVDGVVILTARTLGRIEEPGGRLVRAGAGVPCAKLARYCARSGLGGGEFLAGIPGTVGGALAMNAGAYGTETWDLVHRVETMDRRGRRRWRARNEFEVGYRSVGGPAGEWFTSAELRVVPEDPGAVRARTRGPASGACRLAAGRPAKLRIGIPQSPRRLRGPARRGVRSQGGPCRGCGGLEQARELHRQ